MEALHTIISSSNSLINKGTRECESCGSNVPIIELHGIEHSRCLTCDNRHLEQEMSQYKQKMDKQRLERTFQEYSLVPSDLLKANLENYIPEDPSQSTTLNTAKWYVNNFETIKNGYEWNSILFKGSYGLGKSHLSYAIAKGVQEQGFTAIFIDTPKLLEMIRSTFSSNRSKEKLQESEILRFIDKADLLVLDDIGAEYVKDEKESWATDVIFRLTTSRTDKANIYTTNCSSAELTAKYGAHGGRILSRMMNKTKKVEIFGKDYRIKGW
ncbi:ATP-binding protein [Sutcliffiella cohnii]